MDDVTRPKRAQKRRSGSCSFSIPALPDEIETDEETLPSSAGGSDNESEASGDDADASDQVALVRRPDPKASRRSSRSQVQKTVNYSAKHHPQDARIPGFQHKARSLREAQRSASKKSKKSKPHAVVIDDEDDEAEAEDGTVDEDTRTQSPPRPRKRLRILEAVRPSPRKGRRSKRTQDSNSRPKGRRILISDDVDSIAEQAMRGSQAPGHRSAVSNLASNLHLPHTPEDVTNLRTPTSSERAQCQAFADNAIQLAEDVVQGYDLEDPLDDLERSGDGEVSPAEGSSATGTTRDAEDYYADLSEPRSAHSPTLSLRYGRVSQATRNHQARDELQTACNSPNENEKGLERSVEDQRRAVSRPPICSSTTLIGDKASSAKRRTVSHELTRHTNGTAGEISEHASEFEEQFSITQSRREGQEGSQDDETASNSGTSYGDNLPVSERERSDLEVPDTDDIGSEGNLVNGAIRPSPDHNNESPNVQSDGTVIEDRSSSPQQPDSRLYPSPNTSSGHPVAITPNLITAEQDGSGETPEQVPRLMLREEKELSGTSNIEKAATQSLLQNCGSSQQS